MNMQNRPLRLLFTFSATNKGVKDPCCAKRFRKKGYEP